MSYTIHLHETFQTHRSLEEACRYIADFSTIEQWDHSVASSVKTSDGPVAQGTRFDLMLNFGLRKVPMQYEIEEYSPPHKVVLKGRNPGFCAIDTVSLKQEANGQVTVDWQADVHFEGKLARLAPRMEKRIRDGGTKTVQGLKQALDDNYQPPQPLKRHTIADKLVWPGMWLFTRRGYEKARKRWHPISADMTNKHVVISGATSGLGLASAQRLAHMGARLTLIARDQGKAEKIIEQLKSTTGNDRIHLEVADMSLIGDVKALAERLLQRGEAIDVLINNAGALFNPRSETAEGLETSFALLLLSPFILTEQLKPLLQKSTAARVINVSSGGMYTQRISTSDLENQKGKYSGSVAYARAKRGLVISTEQWAAAWKDDGIVVNAMHPGWADTPGVVSALPEFHKLTQRVLRNSAEGADTIVWLAAATEAGKVSGLFWLDREPHTTHISSRTRETPEQRKKLRHQLTEYASRFDISIAP